MRHKEICTFVIICDARERSEPALGMIILFQTASGGEVLP